MKVSNVEMVCTAEAPLDDLCCHRKLKAEGCEGIKVWSAFRPDKVFYTEKNVEIFFRIQTDNVFEKIECVSVCKKIHVH